MLYEAFGWDCPAFAHLPLLLRPDGNGKLSKRDGDRLGFPVFPTNWTTAEGELYSGYREKGYLPEAFINMLALLGWNPGTTQEIFTLEELCEAFSLERVSKAGAKFDAEKTKWFQQHSLRSLSNETIAAQLHSIDGVDMPLDRLAQICGLMKERATFAQDILTEGAYLFNYPTEFDKETILKKWKDETTSYIQEWSAIVVDISTFNAEEIEKSFKSFLEAKQVGIGAVLLPYRLCLTGVGAGPGMFDISAFLGKEEVLARLETGLTRIQHIRDEASH
jgi:glutamyl-tRNA synthetase